MENDYTDLKLKQPKETYRQKLIQWQQEHTKNQTPCCYRCAKLDYEDKIKTAQEEALRRGKAFDENEIMKIKLPSLAEYEDKKRFNQIRKRDALDRVRGSLINEQVLVGHHVDYQCKIRGCRISIFEPLKKTEKDES